MLLGDINVEVRDKSLKILGQIEPKYLDIQAVRRHLKVGSWKLKLPQEHELAGELWKPGSGIIIRLRDQPWMSGPTDRPKEEASKDDPTGTLTFSGVDDNILLDDARAWPSPAQGNIALQTASNDTRSGLSETLMKQYVSANIGPAAPTSRRGLFAQKLIIQADSHRGPTITKSPRFQKLIELLAEIGVYSSLGFRVIQVGELLEFQVYDVTDRRPFVRFDIENGSLESESIEVSPPSLTRALVAGQEKGVDRQLLQRTTTVSLAAELAWGRQIEMFIDQRQTADVPELEQAGDGKLAEGGFTATAVKAIPSDDESREYLLDWFEGDQVMVVVNGQEAASTITEASFVASSEGIAIAAALGDVTGFKADSALGARVDDTQRRVEALERNTGTDLSMSYDQMRGASSVNSGALGPGVSIWSHAFPSLPMKTKVFVKALGHAGYPATALQLMMSGTAPGGTITENSSPQFMGCAAASWISAAEGFAFTIPEDTAVTGSFISDHTGGTTYPVYWRLFVEWERVSWPS
jgi:hypothetical protein